MGEATVEFRTVGDAGELPEGGVSPFYLEHLKQRVSVARVGGALHAFDDLCACADEPCPLSAGKLEGTTLMCQCHGSQFDIATGAVLRGPATQALVTYEVRENDGEIQVRVT